MKYNRKAVFVDVKEVERIIKQLQGAVKRLRKKAEREIEKEMKTEKLLTAEEVAKILQVHKYTVYDLVRRHGLPVVKLYPRVLRFSWPEVQNWLKQRSGGVDDKMRLVKERKIAQRKKDKQINQRRSKRYERRVGNGDKERKR